MYNIYASTSINFARRKMGGRKSAPALISTHPSFDETRNRGLGKGPRKGKTKDDRVVVNNTCERCFGNGNFVEHSLKT